MNIAIKEELRRLEERIIDDFKEEYEPQNNFDRDLDSVLFDFLDGKFIHMDECISFINSYPLVSIRLWIDSNAESEKNFINFMSGCCDGSDLWSDIVYKTYSRCLYDFCYEKIERIKNNMDEPFLEEEKENEDE